MFAELSNICCTDHQKILQYLMRCIPSKRTHRKVLVIAVVMAFQLPAEVIKGIKRMGHKTTHCPFGDFFRFAIMQGDNGSTCEG